MKPQPPVIFFYDHVAMLSGAEIFLWHLLAHFDREEFVPVVVLGEDGPLREKLCELGIKTQVLNLPGSVQATRKGDLGKRGIAKKLGSVFSILPYIWKLRGLIRQSGASLVHTNSLKSDIIGGLAGILARKPVIWHVHDCIDRNYLPVPAVRLFRRLARLIPTHIISVSHAVEKTLHLPTGTASTVVHNGIPLQPMTLKPEDDAAKNGTQDKAHAVDAEPKTGPRVGIVGRLARWKGQHIFIQAAAQLKKQFPSARFQIVGGALFGEDDYRTEIHQLAESLNLNGSVEFSGFRSDIADIMSRFDVFVHASISPEPFGIVLLEAMMEGKPVIATRGGGVPEIVRDGETGLLVPMNDPAAMANAITKLLSDSELRARMGAAGRERVEKVFLINNTVQGVENVYRQVLSLSS